MRPLKESKRAVLPAPQPPSYSVLIKPSLDVSRYVVPHSPAEDHRTNDRFWRKLADDCLEPHSLYHPPSRSEVEDGRWRVMEMVADGGWPCLARVGLRQPRTSLSPRRWYGECRRPRVAAQSLFQSCEGRTRRSLHKAREELFEVITHIPLSDTHFDPLSQVFSHHSSPPAFGFLNTSDLHTSTARIQVPSGHATLGTLSRKLPPETNHF